MARIIESDSKRKMIKLSSDDILSIIQSYQQTVPRGTVYSDARSYLEDVVIYIPADV